MDGLDAGNSFEGGLISLGGLGTVLQDGVNFIFMGEKYLFSTSSFICCNLKLHNQMALFYTEGSGGCGSGTRKASKIGTCNGYRLQDIFTRTSMNEDKREG